MAKTKTAKVEPRIYANARDTERAAHWVSLIAQIKKDIETWDSLNASFHGGQNDHMIQKVAGMREALAVIETNLTFLVAERPAATWRDFEDLLNSRIAATADSYREGLYRVRDMTRDF